MKCSLCPRRCEAERGENENFGGICKMPLLPKIARADLHFWEEPSVSGEKGSGAVFFSGCPLSCVFCQNEEISSGGFGEIITEKRLAEIFCELEQKGAHNINLVSPTHYVGAIIKALEIYKPKIPIIYNSGGYDDEKVIEKLDKYIDVFLMDLKYLSNERAALYSGAENYPEIASKAVKAAYKIRPECVFKDGIIQKGLIIRHLLLPQGTNEAIKVFDWVRKNTPNAYFSIMSQYIPCGKAAKMPIINRTVTKREYEKVLSYIMGTDFKNVYIQEKSSASKSFIPPFDLTGI